jgi:hypothetical protein
VSSTALHGTPADARIFIASCFSWRRVQAAISAYSAAPFWCRTTQPLKRGSSARSCRPIAAHSCSHMRCVATTMYT